MAALYLLCPGWVTSRADGQDHHVGADDLARLYGVPMSECVALPIGVALLLWCTLEWAVLWPWRLQDLAR